MTENASITSKDLLNVVPRTKGPDLVINKDIRSLEDLRKEFTKSHNSVLSQVRDFLPKLASANDDLQRKMTTNPEFSADIEKLDHEEAPYIEMNIALMEGEFESEDSDPDSSDSEESVEDNVVCGEVTEHNIKLPTGRVTKHADGNLIECINTETGGQPPVHDNCG